MFSFSLALLLFFALDLFFPSRNQSNHVVVFTMKKKREKRFFFKFLECLSPPKLLPSNPFFGSRSHTHTHTSQKSKKKSLQKMIKTVPVYFTIKTTRQHILPEFPQNVSHHHHHPIYIIFFSMIERAVCIFFYTLAPKQNNVVLNYAIYYVK